MEVVPSGRIVVSETSPFHILACRYSATSSERGNQGGTSLINKKQKLPYGRKDKINEV